MGIEYPIEVKEINFEKSDTLQKGWSGECGDFVSIRPCGEEYGGKTYLGIYLGDMALTQGASFNQESGKLKVYQTMHNPAIFVPDLSKVIFGCESWWGMIKDEASLRKITDKDIDDTWYVKALKKLQEADDKIDT